jgi:hypothetical protein
MNVASLAVPHVSTLADQLGDTLDGALASGGASCLWCGGEAVATVADRWTGRVILRCGECGSELEGVGRRRVREGRA